MTEEDDKRMLEMAAKAAGMNDMKWAGGTLGMVKMLDPSRPDETGSIGPSWHPIINQGDAMELAARLAIDISHNHPADQQRYVAAERRGCECAFAPVCCIEDEFEEPQRLTAMCLAVTRAAAAIGEQMP